MLGEIKVTPSELREMASQLDKCRADMEECLTTVGDVMDNNVREGWRDRAGERLMERFRSLRTRYFANYPAAMVDYANFLRQTADQYEAQEAQRLKDVDSLGNMQQ